MSDPLKYKKSKQKIYPSRGKVRGESKAFIIHTLPLISSVAWRSRSINCRRLLDFLEIEHLTNAGKENGNLKAPYNQLEEFGIARGYINKAIEEAEYLGLVICDRGLRESRTKSYMNTYTLTYVATTVYDDKGGSLRYAPTDDWRKLENDVAKAN
jgi:hypothetical protein